MIMIKGFHITYNLISSEAYNLIVVLIIFVKSIIVLKLN